MRVTAVNSFARVHPTPGNGVYIYRYIHIYKGCILFWLINIPPPFSVLTSHSFYNYLSIYPLTFMINSIYLSILVCSSSLLAEAVGYANSTSTEGKNPTPMPTWTRPPIGCKWQPVNLKTRSWWLNSLLPRNCVVKWLAKTTLAFSWNRWAGKEIVSD